MKHLIYICIYIGLTIEGLTDYGLFNLAQLMSSGDWQPVLEWGLLSQVCPFRYFSIFSEWWKQWLPEWYQVHIWQVSPQLSCGDTWQIWTWLKVSNLYFYWIIISRNEEINEWSFSNPHPSCIVNWTLRNELHWNSNPNAKTCVHKKKISVRDVFQMDTIL